MLTIRYFENTCAYSLTKRRNSFPCTTRLIGRVIKLLLTELVVLHYSFDKAVYVSTFDNEFLQVDVHISHSIRFENETIRADECDFVLIAGFCDQ